jgi:hypothetical protein
MVVKNLHKELTLARTYLITPVVFFVIGSCWAIISPIGAAADDDYHLSNIWCIRGESNNCKIDKANNSVFTPRLVNSWPPCYVKWPISTESAECINIVELPLQLVETQRIKNNLDSESIFYLTLNLFVGENILNSIIAMRLFNVLLSSVVLLLALAISPRFIKRALSISWGLTLIPVGIFHIASTNPSSWEISSLGAMWAFIATALHFYKINKLRYLLSIIGFICLAVMAIGSRKESIYLIILEIMIIYFLHRHRKTYKVFSKAYIALLFSGIIVVYYLWNTFHSKLILLVEKSITLKTYLINMIYEIPFFVFSFLGGRNPNFPISNQLTYPPFTYGVSWNDFEFSVISSNLLWIAYLTLCLLALMHVNSRILYSLLLIIFSFILVIFGFKFLNLQYGIVPFLQIQFQSRYFIPIFIFFTSVLFINVKPGRRLSPIVISLFLFFVSTAGSSLAWLDVITRFSVGPKSSPFAFTDQLSWWPLNDSFTRLDFFIFYLIATSLWSYLTIFLWSQARESDQK